MKTRKRAPSACLTFGASIDEDLGSDISSGSEDERPQQQQQQQQQQQRRQRKRQEQPGGFSLSNYFHASKTGKPASGVDSLADLDLPDWGKDLGVGGGGGGGNGDGAAAAAAAAAHPRKLLASLPPKHFNEKERLRVQYEEQFYAWLFQLRQGFSLLFYGFGSKRAMLDKFARDTMIDGGVLSVNGLALGLTARQVLLRAAGMLRRASDRQFRGMADDAVLRDIRNDASGRCLYVVLHNIEGIADPQGQSLLSELAACPNVHLVASIDNVNAPLLWDRGTAARFNWVWHDVTNYAPYVHEAAHVPSLLVGRSEEKAVAGASMVLRTLVPKAREVFRMLARHQLDGSSSSSGAAAGDAAGASDNDGNGGGGGGISFPVLYREARDRFLVQNEVTLRAHLAEFRDHELVATRRGADGADVLVVPMDDDALRSLLEEVGRM